MTADAGLGPDTPGAPRSVSVVIPTYGRRESIRRILEALDRQTLDPAAYEVIVAVDGSQDGTLELVRAFPARHALQAVWGPNRGRATACNAAVRLASGEVIVALDDDMEPAPGCLEAHLLAHPPGSRSCVVGAVPIESRPEASPLSGYMARKFDAHLARLAQEGHRFSVRDFYSGNASIRRDLLLEVGLFDESFRVYGNEDLELAVRLRKAGVAIRYGPEAAAIQHYAKPFPALARDTMAKGRTAVQFASKHPEVLPELQLGAAPTDSRRWRVARDGLLQLTSLVASTPAALTTVTTWIEWAGPRRLDTLYRFLLDYFYWVGVRSARPESPGPDGGAAGPLGG